MKNTLLIILSVVSLILLAATIYFYSQFPGFLVNIGSDYKLGFQIVPRKSITERDCLQAVKEDYAKRMVSYCEEQGITITLEEIWENFEPEGCKIEQNLLPGVETESNQKTEFCEYLFK